MIIGQRPIINQLIDEGVVGHYFYSDETSDKRRGEAELVIILARLNKSNNRPFMGRLTDLSATPPPHPPNLMSMRNFHNAIHPALHMTKKSCMVNSHNTSTCPCFCL